MAQVISLTPPLQPISGEVTLPGSKSHTNRCLLLAALASGQSVLTHASLSDDSRVLIAALTKLGVKIVVQTDLIKINGTGGNFLPVKTSINVGGAGTAMRFLTALCSAIPGAQIILKGNNRLNQRPIRELVDALRQLGANISYLKTPGQAPLLIKGQRLIGSKPISINGTVSSQFFSALLLIASLIKTGLNIKVLGVQASPSYIDMTIEALKNFGAAVKNRGYRQYLVKPNQLPLPRTCPIEGDASGASYFWAMAAVSAGTVKVENINPDSVQGDVQFAGLLEKMGCRVVADRNGCWIQVAGPKILIGIVANMLSMPDTAQTLAVTAAFARGSTKITGLATLKNKETDRLAALKTELKQMNILSQTTADSIFIQGNQPQPARIKTYADHRMAMAFSVAGAKIPLEMREPQVVSKSFPDFWDQVAQLGIKVRNL